jgi:hypothetical protein
MTAGSIDLALMRSNESYYGIAAMPDWRTEHPHYKMEMERLSNFFFPFPWIIAFLFISVFQPSPIQHGRNVYLLIENFEPTFFNACRVATFGLILVLVGLWSHYGKSETDLVREWLNPKRFDLKGRSFFLLHFTLIFGVLGLVLTSVYDVHEFAKWFFVYCILDFGSWLWRRSYLTILLSSTRERLTLSSSALENGSREDSLLLEGYDALEAYYRKRKNNWRISLQAAATLLVFVFSAPITRRYIGDFLDSHSTLKVSWLSQEYIFAAGYIFIVAVLLACEFALGRWRAIVRRQLEGLREQRFFITNQPLTGTPA